LVLIRIDLFDLTFYSLNAIYDYIQHIIKLSVILSILFHSLLLFDIRIHQLIFATFGFLMNMEVLLLNVR